jgi:D-serine deaminase-like pyridoxal phosphate-dependent protein
MSQPAPWYAVSNIADIPSPSLLVYEDRVVENIRRMIAMVGGPARLRPHMKTHKMPEIIKLHLQQGITKFKCATIAEAEMTAAAGALDVLLAYPLVGPNVARFLRLMQQFPETRFCAVADDEGALRALSEAAGVAGLEVEVMLEVNCGMSRTGIAPGAAAVALYQVLAALPHLIPAGLHAYDGHIHDAELKAREAQVEAAYLPVEALRDQLLALGLPVPHYVVSGTPTFGIHARRGSYECSPGTCVLWDWGYGTKHPDLDFLHAALLVTRVISKPAPLRLTLDLGHKAVAAENPHPRVHFLNLPEAVAVMHSEEHLAVETEEAAGVAVGSVLYGVPWHICPTVALHSAAHVVRDGKVAAVWKVAGRERVITI